MNDADLLYQTMYECALQLAAIVGLPEGIGETMLQDFDHRKNATISRSEVPEIGWRGAIMALDFLTVAVGMTDPDAPEVESIEDEMSALLDPRKLRP